MSLIAMDYKKSLPSTSMTNDVGGDENEVMLERIRHEVHFRSAKKLADLFLSNGGIYIKAGQHVASLQHVLPVEYVQAMRVCQDRAPYKTFEEIDALFRREFDRTIDQR